MSYIKVASDQATTLEAASGPHSTFLRTIAQHREVEAQIPIKWVPRKQDEEACARPTLRAWHTAAARGPLWASSASSRGRARL
eukprot:10428580-Alexandrium_andersonii.AAC.1